MVMNINKNTIIRLSRYKNALTRFQSLGFVKVFSDNLGDAVGVTAAQVRKDFSLFGVSGNKKGGYQIDQLIEKLNSILGKNETQKVIITGCGHIAAALMRYKGFEKEGIRIVAGFDIDPAKVNRSSQVPILPLEELREYVKSHAIKIGIVAVPDIAAQQVVDSMLSAGIKGVLNFAPIRLKVSEEVVINNINVEYELENVIYYVNALNKTKGNNK